MSNPELNGPPTLVNTTTNGDQQEPAVAALANGSYVAAWNSGNDVIARVFHANSDPMTGDIPIDTGAADQHAPAVTGLSDGRFVVSWVAGGAITARIFNLDGSAASAEFEVGPGINDLPSISALDNGGFVVTWHHFVGGTNFDVQARAYTSAGTALGNPFLVDGDNVQEVYPVVAGIPGTNGHYVIAWTDMGSPGESDGSASHIRAHIYSGNGTGIGNEFIVNSTTFAEQAWPAVAALADGRFMVTWNDGAQIVGRVFDMNGTPFSDDFSVTAGVYAVDSAVTALDDHRFLISYTQYVNGVPSIYGVVRDADATNDANDGGFAITEAHVAVPSVVVLADGQVVMVATDNAPSNLGDPSGKGVVAQRLDPREAGISLTGSSLNNDWLGTDFDDTLNGGGGSDRIIGGEGEDSLVGGPGQDTLIGDELDILEGGPDADHLVGGGEGTASYASSNAPVAIALFAGYANGGHAAGDMLTGITNLIGSAFSDTLAGNDLPNRLAGGDGDDTLKGGGGFDALAGEAGNDDLFGGADFDVALFTGNRSDYAIGFSADGDVIVADQRPGAPDGTDTLHGVELVGFAEGIHALSGIIEVAALGDVLWRNDDGALAIAGHDLGFLGLSWQVGPVGDFDGDGDADIAIHTGDGEVGFVGMENGENVGLHGLGQAATTWHMRAAGDFDADGDADILWRHDDGQVVTWELEDGNYVVNHNLGSVPTSWRIAGTGDFDRDGDADILWRHQDGEVVTWEMENGAYVVNHNLGSVPTTWQIRGTGDFDGDGDADLLWQHDDGAVVTWEMENGAYVVNHNLPSVPNSWQVQGVHDFDHDGDADILFRHRDGDVVTWEMQSGAYVQNHNYGAVWNAWHIVGTGEFDL